VGCVEFSHNLARRSRLPDVAIPPLSVHEVEVLSLRVFDVRSPYQLGALPSTLWASRPHTVTKLHPPVNMYLYMYSGEAIR
jgi:hypothetical protein